MRQNRPKGPHSSTGRRAQPAWDGPPGSARVGRQRADGGTRRRGVAELPVLAGGEVGRLLSDVDRVVAEALEAAGDQELVKDDLAEMLAAVGAQDDAEHLAVDVVDLVIVLAEALGGDRVAGAERGD